MKTWKLPLLVGGLTAVAVFAAVALAFGGTGMLRVAPVANSSQPMMLAADRGSASDEAWQGCGGSALMQDPQAREDMRALREEHRAEMRAWWEQYGEDPTGDAAQEALERLRQEHLDDMRSLFEKYGVEPRENLGEREGNGWGCGPGVGGAGCGGQGSGEGRGMMDVPGSLNDGQSL